MGRQHFAVGVDIDPRSVGLFQKLVQVLQVVAGHHDEGPLFHIRVHPGGDRGTEGFRVGPVQQGHALEIYLAELHDKGQPILHAVLLPQGGQALVEPAADLRVLIAQIHGVVGVGRHALQTEQQRGAEGDRVCLALPEPAGVLFTAVAAHAAAQLGVHPGGEGPNGIVVKIDVGQGREQAVRQKAGDLLGVLPLALTGVCQPDQAADEGILQIGCLRLLAAHAGADAAAVSRRLLALKAKHV